MVKEQEGLMENQDREASQAKKQLFLRAWRKIAFLIILPQRRKNENRDNRNNRNG